MKSSLTLTEAKERAQHIANMNKHKTCVEKTALGLFISENPDDVPVECKLWVAYPERTDWTEPATEGRGKVILYRYGYQRNGRRIRTRWYSDRDAAKTRMEQRIGAFHDCGRVAGDFDSLPDGSHSGCSRNGGLLWRDARKK